MNDIFETPDPEVTFTPYSIATGRSRNAVPSVEDTQFFDKHNVELDEGTIPAVQAFEAFMGKIYSKDQVDYELDLTSTSNNHKTTSLESPLARFTRLSMEVKELEADLALLVSTKEKNETAQKRIVETAGLAEVHEISRGLAVLQKNLEIMADNESYRPYLDSTSSPTGIVAALQQQLTASFIQQLENWKQTKMEEKIITKVENDGNNEPEVNNETSIVYELYPTSSDQMGGQSLTSDVMNRIAKLESKLHRIESTVGLPDLNQSVDVNEKDFPLLHNKSLTNIVLDMETRVKLLNEKNLDALKTRTTALVHELSLLQRQRDIKGNVPSSGLSDGEEHKRINEIWTQLKHAEDVIASVPSIVQRLLTLKGIHDESLNTVSRVKRIEARNEYLEMLMEEDSKLLHEMETNLEANMKIFETNINLLDARISALTQN